MTTDGFASVPHTMPGAPTARPGIVGAVEPGCRRLSALRPPSLAQAGGRSIRRRNYTPALRGLVQTGVVAALSADEEWAIKRAAIADGPAHARPKSPQTVSLCVTLTGSSWPTFIMRMSHQRPSWSLPGSIRLYHPPLAPEAMTIVWTNSDALRITENAG
jgi:hypothetical protein